jgi:uncharacterized protein (DUF433 family)
MGISTAPLPLNVGLYTPQQAAYYARVSTALVTRWVHGDSSGQSALRPQLRGDPMKTITFLDLVQVMAIRSIRLRKKIALQKVRQCIDFARDEYGIEYPLARKHRAYIFGDDLVIRLEDDRLIEATGKFRHQELNEPLTQLFLEDIGWRPDGLAGDYTAFRWGTRTVTVDPDIRFGHPVVQPCGYAVTTLMDALAAAEGSLQDAAWSFCLEAEDVDTARRYTDVLLGTAA